MKMFIIGFLVCYILAFIVIETDRYDYKEYFMNFGYAVALIVLFIPYSLLHIFQHLVKGISQDEFAKIADLPNKHIGNYYVFHDKDAKYIWDKIFFARVLTNS